MRGSDRRDEFVTTDLLSEWTDPNTAMEAVGASLGIFGDRVSDVRSVLSTESPLRNALLAVLFSLVEGGALEKRACTDGRYAFRWREDIASAAVSAIPIVVDAPAVSKSAPAVELDVSPPPAPARQWRRLVAPTAPLVLPAVSCVLAILAFVWLDRSVALLIAAELTLVGVIGLIRRVPFAGLWTVGVVVATLLLRLS